MVRGATPSYALAYREIEDLLDVLDHRGLCRCCIVGAMLTHALMASEHELGTARTIEAVEHMLNVLRANPTPTPSHVTAH
jgi:hypothetical protein